MIKKYLSPFMLSLIIFLLLALFISFRNNKSTQTISQEAATEQSVKDSIIVRCFLKNINADILSFYSNPDVEVFDYETEVLSVEDKKSVGTLVKFRTTPQIDAHNPIGEDELTYHITPNGEITLTDYKHVKNYSSQ